jgi:glycolate oxidase FAD binding subunit
MISVTSEAELADAVAAAQSPLHVQGGGTRPIGQTTGEILSVSALTGIELYEPGALTIVAKSGTPLAEVEAALAAENQRLPFEPMDHQALLGTTGTPTLGGMVASNVSGPRRVQAGACRDCLIGVRFVDGTGKALSNGGRVMKNVTGYDLVKLMAGSYGTLGVLSEVAFKVLPSVEASATLVIHGLKDKDAVAALSKALGSPFEVSGAAHCPAGSDGTPETLIRLEGFTESVRYRTDRLKDLLAGTGEISIETNPDTVAARWKAIRDVEAFAGHDGDVWRISVKQSDGPEVGARLKSADVMYDWGGGLVWAKLPEGVDIRPKLDGIAGHATLVRASTATRAKIQTFAPENAVLAKISNELRGRFDPRGILNPGLMG